MTLLSMLFAILNPIISQSAALVFESKEEEGHRIWRTGELVGKMEKEKSKKVEFVKVQALIEKAEKENPEEDTPYNNYLYDTLDRIIKDIGLTIDSDHVLDKPEEAYSKRVLEELEKQL